MYKSELQKFSRTKKSLNLPLNVMLVVLVTWLSEHGLSKDPKTMHTAYVQNPSTYLEQKSPSMV